MEIPPVPYSRHDLDKAKSSIDGGPPSGREAIDYESELEVPLEEFRNKKVLDLGAGSGLGFARGLKEMGVESEVHSFSPAFAEPGPAQEATGFVQDEASTLVVAGMAEALPYRENSFDIVVSLHLFEHIRSIPNLISIVEEIVRVLKPNGVAHIGPIAEYRPPRFDAESFLMTRPLIENTFPTKVGFEFSWKRNKPPLDVIVVSDGQSKQGTFGCVLSITKI